MFDGNLFLYFCFGSEINKFVFFMMHSVHDLSRIQSALAQ